MSASQLSICRNALLMLGAQPITDPSDNSDRALLAASLYDSARDSVLRSHPWNCAVKRVVLAPDSAAPPYGYSAQFTLPADFLRILSVGEDNEDVDYKIESGKIVASGTVLALRYIWRNTNEATWDALLVKAMELHMAAEMAYAVTMSTSKQEMQERKLAAHMKLCRAVDGQDDPAQQLGDEYLLSSRFGNVRTVPGG